MEKTLRFIEKIIPKKAYRAAQPIYHFLLNLIGAIIYGFPAKKMYIIGVTGTKGKSTTTEIINSILEEAGIATMVTNTIRFKIGNKSIPNKFKMSMPGRFFMQKKLKEGLEAGCTHAIIEMTSEGAKQFRNKFIPLNAFVFTNLAPEHIESHGSFKNYLTAKLKIAQNLKKGTETIGVINLDDKESEIFLKQKYSKKIPYSLSDAKPIDLSDGIKMRFKKNTLYSKLNGEFNAYNIMASASLCDALGIDDEIIRKGIENLEMIPGRVQKIKEGQNFEIIIDYAHTAESLEALYSAFPQKNKICVLGNTGGGRDKWKRPVMAKVAEKYCDEIILTNEDPYDEDPLSIIKEMEKVITQKPVEIILDRRQAISKSLKKAATQPSESIVLITGKGTDPYIMEAHSQKTPWSDYEVAREEILKIIK